MTQPVHVQSDIQVMQDRDGNLVNVPVAQVKDAYLSGQFGFADGVPVHLRGSNGQVQAVDGSTAGQILGSAEGLRTGTASAVDYALQEERKKYETAGQIALTAGEGVGRGLTFGLSDAALSAAGADTAKRQLYNPGTAIAGELGGALAPLLFTGGGSGAATAASMGGRGLVAGARGGEAALALARGAEAANAAREVGLLGRAGNAITAPTRALSEGAGILGNLAERGVVGMGATEGGMLARGARAAVTGATEGAVYGAGQAIGDASLRNEPITVEKILAGAGHGALFGGALGAGVVGAGGLLAKGASAAKTGAESVIQRLANKEAGEAAAQGESMIGKLLRSTSEEAAIKSLGGTQKQVGKVEQLIERAGDEAAQKAMRSRIRDVILDEAPQAIGKAKGAILNEAERAQGIATWMEQAGAKKGAMVEQINAAGVKPSVSGFEAKAEELAKAAERRYGGEGVAAKIREEAATFAKTFAANGGDFAALDKARNSFLSTFEAGHSRILADAGKKMSEEIRREVARAVEPLGKDAAKAWHSAARDFDIATHIAPMAENGIGRAADGGGILDKLSGAPAIAGALLGGAPLGAAMAAGSAIGGKLVKRYGDNVLAVATRGAAEGQLLSSLRAAADSRMGEGVAKFLGQTAGRAKNADVHPLVQSLRHGTERAADRDKAFAQRRAEMSETIGRPEVVRAKMATTIQHAPPDLVQAVAQKKIDAESFLKSKDPTPPNAVGTLTPVASGGPRVSPVEQARFLRYAKAVDDPLSVLGDLEKGRLSREGVEALRTVYPGMYGELQGHVIAGLAQRKEPLTYQQETALSVLLGVPSARSPKDVAGYQQSIAAPPDQPPAPRPPGNTMALAAGLASKTTQIESGGK